MFHPLTALDLLLMNFVLIQVVLLRASWLKKDVEIQDVGALKVEAIDPVFRKQALQMQVEEFGDVLKVQSK